jgi:hypothetical protein
VRAPALACPPAPLRPPFRRRLTFEELESRLLMSADIQPFVSDALLATPARNGAEFRAVVPERPDTPALVFAAPLRQAAEIAFVDTAAPDHERLVGALRESAAAARAELSAPPMTPSRPT